MDKISCSIAILTLNSGKTLHQCLQSIKDFDDVIILDGNSTDNTHAIAHAFNVPVHKQYDTEEKNVRIKNFTEMRMKGDTLLRYDWMFWIDADEYASPELVDTIREIMASKPHTKTAYYAVKKMVMGDRVIDHSFNGHIHSMRMYNKKSGIVWKPSKAVHEKLYIPNDVTVVNLSQCCYSRFTSSYREAIKKDDYYLSLVRQKMRSKKPAEKSKKVLIKAMIKNFLRALLIGWRSAVMYGRYGFAHTLPIPHAWRYVRYHLFISYYRFKELFV